MKKQLRLIAGLSALALLCAARSGAQTAAYQYPFQNPDMPLEDRVNNIISLMTPDEKVALLSQSPGVQRLGIRSMQQAEGLHGVKSGGGATTTYPQAIGLGETWDTEILRQVGATEGYEARYNFQRARGGRGAEAPPAAAATPAAANPAGTNGAPPRGRGGRGGGGGSLIIRAPNADIGRDIRWGRTEECYGEDAFMNGTLATAFIKGMQGDDPKYWQAAALLKHFLANSNERGRSGSSSDFDDRLFYEYYSVPFRMGWVEGGARCFMASYNAWNKIPMTANPIIPDVVIKDWGVDGVICTDAGSLGNMVRAHRYYPDVAHGAAGAIKAGINQFLDTFEAPTRDALTQNLLTEDDITKSIKGTFRVFIRLGLLDPPDRNPYAKIGTDPTPPWMTQKAKDSVRLATQESVVLLKNSGNFLPLSKTAFKSIAVIGPRGDEVVKDWYGSTPPYPAVTPLAGIKDKVGEAVNVQFADGKDVTNAVALAKSSDLAILCVGNSPDAGGWMKVNDDSEGREAIDRVNITLGSGQEELVRQVFAANPKTVVVLVSSFPYAINWEQENVPAIVHLANSSQEMGNGLADVLFGDYNPAGRTCQTWVKSTNDIPPMMDYDIRHGRTYMYFKGEPLYPFGYGLSYTTFAYSNLRTSAPSLNAKGSIDVSVDVKNTGARAGDEVVQLYVKHIGSTVERPGKELRGFKRVAIKPGETKTVTLTLPASRLAYWNTTSKSWVVENDKVQLMVGASSADTKLDRTIDVTP
jgi:beta-glucosidase